MNFLTSLGIGRRIYFSVLSAFVLFAAAFILFQQNREKQYKIDNLNLRLQDYNLRMHDWMQVAQHPNEQALDRYVATHALNELRVTIIDRNGHVLYDNRKKNYTQLPNHLTRPEAQPLSVTAPHWAPISFIRPHAFHTTTALSFVVPCPTITIWSSR